MVENDSSDSMAFEFEEIDEDILLRVEDQQYFHLISFSATPTPDPGASIASKTPPTCSGMAIATDGGRGNTKCAEAGGTARTTCHSSSTTTTYDPLLYNLD